MTQLDQEQRDFILESAIQAPSADNHHRIRFRVEGATILVSSTEEIRPAGGYKRVLALLSLGAVVENLTLAATRFGFGADIQICIDPDNHGLRVVITLMPGQAGENPLWRYIAQRHTNRSLKFHGPILGDGEKQTLATEIQVFSSIRLLWLENAADRAQALKLMRSAETERFHDQNLHAELFSAIQFAVGWRNICPEGLPPGALGIEPPMRPFFALLRHWSVMRLANRFGIHHLLGWRACDLPCRLAPNLGLLTVPATDNRSILMAGQALQRLWLGLTRQNRVLQPMPASALYALQGAKSEGIRSALQQHLQEGWQVLTPNSIPIMLFRVGYAQPAKIASGRLPVSHYLEK